MTSIARNGINTRVDKGKKRRARISTTRPFDKEASSLC
jgi:hypothetical protein